MDAATERELLTRAQRGDGAAFEELIAPHTPRLFRLCYAVLRDVGLAEQAVQEALRRAWEARRRCRGSFKSWLFTIARNVARDIHQEAYRRHTVPLGEETGEAFHRAGEPHEEDVVRRRLIEDALDRLPVEPREIIVLNHFAGLDLREAADVLGISHDAARQRHRRAIAALRSILEPPDSPDAG